MKRDPSDALVFVGGTGPEGRGLALRFAAAGERVIIGSRDRQRAGATAAEIRAAVPGALVDAAENIEAIGRSRRIVLALPPSVLAAFLGTAAGALAGKLVIDVTVPLVVRNGFAEIVSIEGASSAGELIQTRVSTARVVSAFKNLPADRLRDLARPLEGDVIVCGNDREARSEVATLVARLGGPRAVDAGRLANARYLEAIAALLVNLNRRHKSLASIAVVGLGPTR